MASIKTEAYPFYIKTQGIVHIKHPPPRLQKSIY